jgi:hypothetical protein
MCRRNHLLGVSILAFGLGILVGYSLESWFLCFFGGIGLMIFGICTMRQK